MIHTDPHIRESFPNIFSGIPGPETRNSWLSACPRPPHIHTTPHARTFNIRPHSRLTAVLFTARALIDGKSWVCLHTQPRICAHAHTRRRLSSWFGPWTHKTIKKLGSQYTCCTTKLPLNRRNFKVCSPDVRACFLPFPVSVEALLSWKEFGNPVQHSQNWFNSAIIIHVLMWVKGE